MMEIGGDAAGQLADAALIGAAFERGGGGDQGHGGACGNCGAALSGRYCHVCGQRGHIHRSVLHLAEEFFHGLLHLDGKIWRTAPLLMFRPGALTRRYVEGQRVRFVSPIALFLFSVFLMFFAVATLDERQGAPQAAAIPPVAQAELKKDLSEARDQVGRAMDDSAARQEVRSAIDKAEKAAEAPPAAGDDDADQMFSSPLGLDWRAVSKKLARKKNLIDFGTPAMQQRVRASLADPDLLVYKLRSAASEYSFLLVPASVPFLWLMFFWRRGVHLYDHVIFSLHSLSFMALFVTLMIFAFEAELLRNLWWLLAAVPPLHMFFHLRGTYGLGVFGALGRTCILSVAALIVLCCYVATILILGLVH